MIGWVVMAVAALVLWRWGRRKRDVVLRLWGHEWTREEFCCHFLITGATGTGKTSRALIPIIHGVRKKRPSTGVLAIDSKGVLWQPLSAVARDLGQEGDLRLIRVRPPEVPREEWTPPLRMNVLADRSIPWTTYAKILVDTATAAGQRGGQSFFKEASRDAIAHAMQALDLVGAEVTLENVHNVLCVSEDMAWLALELAKKGAAARGEAAYFKDFAAQPPEQKGATVATVANFLRPYAVTDIADVFCSVDPNFSLGEIDAGRLICLSIPQTFQLERKYLNLLCKQLFYLHAFRRFDLPRAEMRKRNMVTLVLDEGQKTTLLSEDGFADHSTVDELREAGVCVVLATQTPLSLYAAFDHEGKADVFMANLRTQIHFRAADEKGAKIISQRLGGREARKYSGNECEGRRSRSWQVVDEPWVKPERLIALIEGQAIVAREGVSRPRIGVLPLTRLTGRA